MEIHAGYLPGCIGRIAELHGTYYARASGFGVPFEAKVARELAEFCLRFEPDADGLWLACVDGTVQGALVLDARHVADEGAHLRWFIMSDALRGSGVGNRLLGTALRFSRARGYRRLFLWTFDELHAARHLYLKHGFRLETEMHGRTWGREVNEQKYVLDLEDPRPDG